MFIPAIKQRLQQGPTVAPESYSHKVLRFTKSVGLSLGFTLSLGAVSLLFTYSNSAMAAEENAAAPAASAAAAAVPVNEPQPTTQDTSNSTKVAAGSFYQSLGELPDVKELKNVSFETPMKIYTRDGKLIGEFGEHKRIPVSLDQIPLRLQQAFLAIEDSRFYEHSGVDPIGILRAIVVAATSGGASQGASTITQQVARNFFLSRDRTIERKLKEMFIAWRMEQVLSKEEILELYLNKIALGHRSYGVVAAAQTYYGKTLDQLTLAEMATIAGLPKAPSTLNPITNPQRAKERRHLVLQRMLTLGYITPEEFKEADEAPSRTFFHSAPLEAYAPYVAEEVRQAVINKYGTDAYIDGFKIYTTVDSKYQDYAHNAIFNALSAYEVRHGYRGPLINIFDPTRGIRGSAKLPTEKNGKNANANNGVIMQARQAIIDQYKAQNVSYDYKEIAALVDSQHLVNVDFTAFTQDQLMETIGKENKYKSITPALVLSVNDETKEAVVLDPTGAQLVLTWEGMSWARAFRNDRTQGDAPKVPSEFLLPGDLVFTYVQTITPDPQKRKKKDAPQEPYPLLTLTQIPDVESAIIAIDPHDGAVRAMAGGFDFEKSKFNRTTQLLRQTGSNFKPFIYSSAFASGIAINSVIPDEPIRTWDVGSRTWWQPRNSPNRFEGLMTLREGLAKSKNSISIRTIRHVGVKNAIQHLRKFDIFVPKFQQSESMALGSVELTPLQVATAYAAFANGGYKLTPYLIDRIELESGKLIYQANPYYADATREDVVKNDIPLIYKDGYQPNTREQDVLDRVNNFDQWKIKYRAQQQAQQAQFAQQQPNLAADPAAATATPETMTTEDELLANVVLDEQAQAQRAAEALNAARAQQAALAGPSDDPKAASGVILMDLDRLAKPDPEGQQAPQILSHGHAYLVTSLMHSNVYGATGLSGRYWGTGARAASITGRDDLYAKTGTTNNVHDAWFSGFNGNLVVTSWVGFDNDRDLGYSRLRGSESGSATALPVFAEFFKNAQQGVESAFISAPRGIIYMRNRDQVEPAIPGMRIIDDGASYESVENTGIDSSTVNDGDIF